MKLENLDKAPAVLIIRPAQYSDYSAMTTTEDGTNLTKIIAHNVTVAGLLETAYSISQPRIILPTNVPTNQYELMLTLTNHQMEALQEALKKNLESPPDVNLV